MPQHPATTVPSVVRRLVPKYEWRHVKMFAAVRGLVALWLVVLGVILCAYGFWWGASLFTLAGLIGFLAYQMPQWKLMLDAEQSPHQVA